MRPKTNFFNVIRVGTDKSVNILTLKFSEMSSLAGET